MEKALFEVLQEAAPDADQGQWQDLNLQLLTARLKNMLGDDVLPIQVSRLLQSLARDRDANSHQQICFELQQFKRDYLHLRTLGNYSWRQISRFGEKRRKTAAKILAMLVEKIPKNARSNKSLLVATTIGELVEVIESDLELASDIPPAQRRKAVDLVLVYLHRQEVLILNQGTTVMRRAMTIRIKGERQGAYRKDDYQQLDQHYGNRLLQVHVIGEYATIELKKQGGSREYVRDYFHAPEDEFIKRYFAGRRKILQRSTSEDSWKAIVEALNETQKEVVQDDSDTNRLVLAGPGSGKTRIIVHRIAYLLRVRRVPAHSIVALTFNRHAANEIRQRLIALVGADAYGLTVQTYHSMAMRLTGTRFERHDTVDENRLTGR